MSKKIEHLRSFTFLFYGHSITHSILLNKVIENISMVGSNMVILVPYGMDHNPYESNYHLVLRVCNFEIINNNHTRIINWLSNIFRSIVQ